MEKTIFDDLGGKKLVLGLIHLKPMPGTPFYEDGNLEASLKKALGDAKALQNGGADGCLLQSVDGIYGAEDDTDYARVATLAMIAARVRDATGPDFKIGVQLMFNCITPSLAVAKAVNADFIRCSVLVGASDSTYGPGVSNTLKVMNYRRQIEAQNVGMIAEISGYHNKSGTEEGLVGALASTAMRAGANAVEVCSRDEALNEQLVLSAKKAGEIPVILGGSTTVENCQRRLRYADGALVGSEFEGGRWGGPVIESIVEQYCKKVRQIEG